jgi:hypothetical protein
MDRVRQWWESYHFSGSPSFVFASKLKALKADLKKWTQESFGNVAVKQTKLVIDLANLDCGRGTTFEWGREDSKGCNCRGV